MFMLRRNLALVLVVICLLLAGCKGAKEIGKTLGALVEVRGEIMKKYNESGVDVRVNAGRFSGISVNFINSPLNDKAPGDRVKRAQETAEIVKAHYPDIKTVDQIIVSFSQDKTVLIVFHSWRIFDIYRFDNQARMITDSGETYTSGNEDPTKPNTLYSPNRNETDVSSNGIQLEGTPENGLTMVPHFSLVGNVNKVTPKPPATVSLDFASFSAKQRFHGVTKIVFTTNKKISFRTDGQFSTSHLSDGMVSEILYLKIPRADFIKIAEGSDLVIELGDSGFRLAPQQVLQLQRMADFLRLPDSSRTDAQH
jgi:hypothetical protein